MAIKHVKKYFESVEKLYFEMIKNLRELEEDLQAGEMTQEEMDNFLKPVQSIKDNYLRGAYIMHLLYLPNRSKVEQDMLKALEPEKRFFIENKLTLEDMEYESKNILKDFR